MLNKQCSCNIIKSYIMKYFLFLLLSFFSVGASAQDVIVKKNGSTILCKILEVGTSEVKYKKHSNPKGPTYIID